MADPVAQSCSWYDVSCGLSWLADEIKSLGLWFLEKILGGVASVLELIPAPAFLSFHSMSVPPFVSWFLEPFQIATGISMIVSAYVARFVLRRIPGIG